MVFDSAFKGLMIRRNRDLRSSWEWRSRLWYCGCHNPGGHKV